MDAINFLRVTAPSKTFTSVKSAFSKYLSNSLNLDGNAILFIILANLVHFRQSSILQLNL